MQDGDAPTLAGLLVAVKDNVDVAGLATTAACSGFAYRPDRTATAVARLVDAGAVVLGKTNMDQFATGLVGTRSPYGAVRCAWDPARVAGGSSSGSAVAVGLGIADIGVGTDTAGSGRVPAAFGGIVGLKATPGLVPATGVVPACADYDCVTVLAGDLRTARRALAVMVGPDDTDPRSRSWPDDVRLAAPPVPHVAVPRPTDLTALTAGYRDAFAAAVDYGRRLGWATSEMDVSEMLEAATLLYDGAIVAERHAAVGTFLEGSPEGADPVVSEIIRAPGGVRGTDFAADLDWIARVRAHTEHALRGFDGLLLPVTVEHPTVEAVRADPVGVNRRLGTYTNFANLLDMTAMAVPLGVADGGPFGVMVLAPAFSDHVALDLASRLTGDHGGPPMTGESRALLVAGAADVPEFGYSGVGHSPVSPTARNPWEPATTPGGSSAGSGIAVATGMSPVALASDGGGSIRIPAAHCGIYGFKASMGRVPLYPGCRDERYPGVSSWETLECIGPLSRTVADAALMMDVLAGPDPRDRHSLPGGDVDWRAAGAVGDLRGHRIAFSADLGYLSVDPEVRRVVADAADAFTELGATVVEADPGWDDPYATFWALVAADSDLAGMRALVARYGSEMSPYLVDLLTRPWTAEDFTDAATTRKALVNRMWRFMADYDLLVTPTLTVPPFALGMQGPEIVDGRMVPPSAWLGFTFPINMTGQPAASCPAGFTADGRPVGLHIVGPHLGDAAVLGASAAFETARPWHDRWPGIVEQARSGGAPRIPVAVM